MTSAFAESPPWNLPLLAEWALCLRSYGDPLHLSFKRLRSLGKLYGVGHRDCPLCSSRVLQCQEGLCTDVDAWAREPDCFAYRQWDSPFLPRSTPPSLLGAACWQIPGSRKRCPESWELPSWEASTASSTPCETCWISIQQA